MHDGILRHDLVGLVAGTLGVAADTLGHDTNLIELGLDSINLMRLAGRLRRQGYEIDFAQMAAEPRLSAWMALLGERAREADREGAPSAVALDESEPFELAVMQHAYWVGRESVQRLGGVSAHFYNEFDGVGVEPERLGVAVRALLARHGMLRLQIQSDGRQRILPHSPWPGLRVHDLRAGSPSEAEQALAVVRRELSHRMMDLAAGEVFDVQLSLLPDALRPRRTRLHVNMDMVAADALSVRVLLADLAQLYAGEGAALPALAYSYPRYRADRSAALARPRPARAIAADRAFWQARLAELPGPPQLPAALEGSAIGATTVVRRHRWFGPDEVHEFERHARHAGLTPAMALAAVFAEVLTAWSSEPMFLMNLPLFDRELLHPDVPLLVGDFTSSLLLAWDGSVPGSFAERARRLQERFHEDASHRGVSGVEVLRELSRQRGEQVLAPVVYTSALGLGELYAPSVKRLFGTPSWIISQGPQVWLDAQVTEFDGGLLLNVDAREDAFAPGVLDAMFAAHGRCIELLLRSERAWREPLSPLLPAAQLEARARANATARPISRAGLCDAFFERARQFPDAPAVVGEAQQLSYGQLADAALRVAAHLLRQGVSPGDLVAIHLPKGPAQIAAVLGVLAAGAAYLPVGIDQPTFRRDRILTRAGVRLAITGSAGEAWPLGVSSLPFELASKTPPATAPVAVDPGWLAYVIFTSGSTGEPKGVEITHGAALNTVADINRRFEVRPSDRVLAVSALDFDLSVYDIFGLLSAGGTLVLIDERERRDAIRWRELIERHAVTIWNSVPTLLEMLLAATKPGEPLGALRLALVSGDWIARDLPGRLVHRRPGCRFISLGGATEASIWSNYFEVKALDPAWKSIPYGWPLTNQRFRVVDALGRDCPDWVPGELWIGGAGLARGYRGDPELTALKFPVLEGERWYRTGDRARYFPDGCVEFMGRIDAQVKLRGHRIELGEIEAALAAYPGIARAVAVLGARGLAAVVALGPSAPEPAAEGEIIDLNHPPASWASLHGFLAERLPAVMVPDVIWLRADLPLTPNGKVDRGTLCRLLDARSPRTQRAETPPADELEGRVARVWADVLGRPAVYRESDFFASGGDSLLATRLVRRLRDEGFEGVRLAELFARPKLSEFAATLRLGDVAPQVICRADPEHRHDPFPPTAVQRAYWLGRDERFTLGGVGCHFYREYDAVDLDVPRLERALARLIERHEMLRAVFDAGGQQRILERVPPFAIERIDVDGDPSQAIARQREAYAHRVLDPARWPLFAVFAVCSGVRTRLGVLLDNLILDALSILTFYSELDAVYASPHAELAPIGLSFRDYVLSCTPEPRALDAAWEYWQRQLPELPPAPDLPLAVDPVSLGRPRFVRHEGRLDAARWRRIVAAGAEHAVTPSALLLTSFAEVLSRWSRRPDLTLNLTLFDRREVHPDVHRVLGDFTSLTLIGYRPITGESWVARARRLQAELAAALDHREVSSIDLVRELSKRSGEPVSMPVVFTSALGVPGGTRAPETGPFSRQLWGLTQTPQVWLDHQVVEVEGGLALNWDVVDGLFPDGLVETMFAAYLQVLEWLSDTDPAQPLPDLLPSAQREQRRHVNATFGDCPSEGLHEAFFRRARSEPERMALCWGDDGGMTYRELADESLRIAGALTARGVERGQIVAVQLPKGPDQIAAVLGVLAVGAAYLPIGVDQPEARRNRMLARAGVRHLLGGAGRHTEQPAGVRFCAFSEAASSPGRDAPVPVDPEQLAYVIFTSGSTGEPKGVEIAHRAALNTVHDINERFRVGPDDRLLGVSALDFDLSVYDIFGLLSAGGALVTIDEESRRDARRWHALARRHRVTIWNSVPTLLDMLLVVGSPAEPPGALRLALVSGDWVGLDLPGRLREQQPSCRFVALGGATEASIWSNCFEVDAVVPGWRSIPYGRPLSNQRFRVVDAHGRDCPDWVPGELWIGGLGVARGYHGAADLTAEKFVLGGDGGRWYRTGDIGRYWPDGNLEFLGRVDQQVKLRGHRVELGEVEAALASHPAVRRALALVHDGRLVAAVVPEPGRRDAAAAGVPSEVPEGGALAFDVDALREHLATLLPPQWLPERIVIAGELALTANGKVDRALVARSFARAPALHAEPPRSLWERRVAELWQGLLGSGPIGRQQSFFQLGGDSLLATRFIEALRREHAIVLALRQLFSAPTLAEVAAALEAEQGTPIELEEGTL